jgi:hypothetical protein
MASSAAKKAASAGHQVEAATNRQAERLRSLIDDVEDGMRSRTSRLRLEVLAVGITTWGTLIAGLVWLGTRA